MNSPPQSAVFLSYASQDAAAARHICTALRAAGVEVWFDQNELRGGDAWDAQIRGQIKSCTLFVPVISAATEARHEGYFRLEWRLADQRTHLMGRARAFLLPVCIDETKSEGADVPDSFHAVQWTRLPRGEAPPEFVARVQTLLARGSGVATSGAATAGPWPAVPVRGARRGWIGWAAGIGAVALGAAGWWALRDKPPAAQPVPAQVAGMNAPHLRSIAVLPFANLSAEPDQTGFTDGIHDEMITALGRVAALKIIGRTSVLPYADPAKRDLRKIAAALGIGAVLEGTVRRGGGEVRIAVELVDALSSQQVWSDVFAGKLENVFDLQAQIARKVAAEVNAKLTENEQRLLGRRPTESARAHDLYLEARKLSIGLSASAPRQEWERALRVLEQATEADPDFAQAFAFLARRHSAMYWFGSLDPSPERRELARLAMVRAGRLAPTAPETRLAEGYFAYACDLNWNEAMRHYQAALADMPNDAELPLQIGATFRRLGRFPEAVPMLRRAVELNPLDPGYAQTLIEALLMLRRHTEAVAVGVRYGAESPEFTGVRRAVAFARFEVSGDRAALVRDLRALPPAGRDPLGVMPKYESALFGGDLAEAARVLKEPRLTTVQGINAVVAEPVSILRAYLACLLGRADEARAHAREALEFMRAGKWTYRQRTMVALAIVRATAYGGDHAEARRLADELRSELRGEDGYDEPHVLHELGRIYVLLGQPEPALACLRAITTGVSPTDGGPRLLQIDPVWSRLADDPRFREILRQVKPL